MSVVWFDVIDSLVDSNYLAQDVQEFLVYLLDRLQMELRGEVNNSTGPSLRASSFNLRKSASAISALSSLASQQQQQQQQPEKNDIINDIFEGHLLSEITCHNCNHKSEKCDSFMGIDRISFLSLVCVTFVFCLILFLTVCC